MQRLGFIILHPVLQIHPKKRLYVETRLCLLYNETSVAEPS